MLHKSDQFVIQIGSTSLLFERSSQDHALFLTLGDALAQIQSFETSIAFFLSSLEHKSSDTETSQDDFSRLMQLYTKKTLGTVIRIFRDYIKDDQVADMLETVREKRNYLVHSILRKYGWPIMGDEGYIEAILEVNEIIHLLEEVEKDVTKYLIQKKLLKLIAVHINHDTGDIEIL